MIPSSIGTILPCIYAYVKKSSGSAGTINKHCRFIIFICKRKIERNELIQKTAIRNKSNRRFCYRNIYFCPERSSGVNIEVYGNVSIYL